MLPCVFRSVQNNTVFKHTQVYNVNHVKVLQHHVTLLQQSVPTKWWR